MKKVAKEKIEGKAKEERGEGSARENEGLWLREDNAESSAISINYLLIVCRLARISRDGSCFLELTTRFLLSAPASCCEPQGLLVSWCACPVAAKSLNNHRHANK